MNSLLEKIVKEMNLIPIDDKYRSYIESTYEKALDDKYEYRTVDGKHVYSPEYLLNMCKEGEGEYV